jgi:hypothetical protein
MQQSILAIDNTSSLFLSTYGLILLYYHSSNIPIISLHNAGINNSMKVVSYSIHNYDNYVGRMISFNTVVNGESNINNCNNNNNNSNITINAHISPNIHNVLPP